jgi:hypothetical protein
MTPKEAEEKYGKANLKKMEKYMEGITVSIDPKTRKIDIPESDLIRAYEMVTKHKSSIPWD